MREEGEGRKYMGEGKRGELREKKREGRRNMG